MHFHRSYCHGGVSC